MGSFGPEVNEALQDPCARIALPLPWQGAMQKQGGVVSWKAFGASVSSATVVVSQAVNKEGVQFPQDCCLVRSDAGRCFV